jgi:hypothetical protein
LGLQIAKVSIIPDDDKGGYLSLVDNTEISERVAVSFWASIAVEELHHVYYPQFKWDIKDNNTENDRLWFIRTINDSFTIRKLRLTQTVAERKQKQEELKVKARTIIEQSWPAVEALAVTLLEQRELTGEQAEQIIAATLNT